MLARAAALTLGRQLASAVPTLKQMEKQPDRPVIRTRLETADLRAAWQQQAAAWLAWARTPGHDSYWQFHRDQFLELVPPPERRTLDLGCGEGRMSRDLKQLGHNVVAVDASPALLAAAREADPDIETHLGDAAILPFEESSFDLVVAFMSLQDIATTSRVRSARQHVFCRAAAGSVWPSSIPSTRRAGSRETRPPTARSRSPARISIVRTTPTMSFAMGWRSTS